MDPNAALDDLITFVMNGEFLEAKDSLDTLQRWRNAGGFAPRDPRPNGTQRPGAGWLHG